MRNVWLVAMLLVLASFARAARAETLEAPAAGAAFTLGEGRFACARPTGGWTLESGGRALRPPATAAAIGTTTELRVGRSPADCAQAPPTAAVVKLVVTAPWPVIDPAGFTFAVDEGRLVGRGRPLLGVRVSWPTDDGLHSDACLDPKRDGASETCAWGVPKTVPADPTTSALRWWPAGAVVAQDAVIVGVDGKRAAAEAFAIVPSRVEVMDLLPPAASVDVSSGIGRAALTHPDVVAGVDCGGLHCSIEGGLLVVQAPPAAVAAVDVKFRLAPHVSYVRKNPADAQPTIRVSILRCPMSIASGPPMRGVDGVRAIVRIEGACMHDVAALGFLAGAARVDVSQVVSATDATYAVLELGTLRGPEVSIAAVRGEGDATVVAMARSETRPAPVVHTKLEIGGFPPIDFIPNNREAVVYVPHIAGGELVLLPVTDVYDARVEHGITMVQGDVDAVGLVALEFGVRAPGLPAPLDAVNLAVLTDALQRSVKEANIPAPFGPSAESKDALAEVLCKDARGVDHRLTPGVTLHLPFSARYGCRVVLHRERLAPAFGTQKLTLEIEIDKLDGTPRGEAHVTQTIVLRSGSEPRVAWIKGVVAPYDRIVVRLSHTADEAHYLGALEIASGEPAVQWTAVLGVAGVRIYATTAIPTGLYRFGTAETSGVLTLSLGVLSRFTWVDSLGHEGILGLEAGIMAFGITGQDVATTPPCPTCTAQPLTQVGAVVGMGLSLPIANAGAPTQASVNLHAWFEQRIAGSGPNESASARALIFGPSISIGNVGTTF